MTTLQRTPNAPVNETDLRLQILNSFLSTPHRELGQVIPIHSTIAQQDPLFYRQLAAWYFRKGEIRDHQEAFIITLCLDNFEGNRDIGLAMLRELPPFRVMRIVDYILGTVKKTDVFDKDAKKAYWKAVKAVRDPILKEAGIVMPKAPKSPKPAKGAKGKVKRAKLPKVKIPAEIRARIAEATKGIEKAKPVRTTEERKGLFKNAPNSLKTEIARYLRERENNDAWFNATVVSSKKHLRRLYTVMHIKPSDRAKEIIFEGKNPEDSTMAALAEIAKMTDPIQQARAIIEHKIPYRIASSVVVEMSPTVILALVEVMSPQELINNVSSLQQRGAFDNPDIKAAIDAKLATAKSSKKVAALKSNEAIKAGDLDESTQAALRDVADAQVKSRGRIKHRTALLIDKSSSMQTSIEVGKQIGAMVSAVAETDFYCYAFDSLAYPITPTGKTLSDWESALKGIKAGGQTSCGVAVDMMRRQKRPVDQIIMVSDGGDNQSPNFATAYTNYCRELGITPSVVMVKVPGDYDKVSPTAKAAGIDMDIWNFNGDYYSLPGLIPILCKTSKMDLLMEVMGFKLPIRKSA